MSSFTFAEHTYRVYSGAIDVVHGVCCEEIESYWSGDDHETSGCSWVVHPRCHASNLTPATRLRYIPYLSDHMSDLVGVDQADSHAAMHARSPRPQRNTAANCPHGPLRPIRITEVHLPTVLTSSLDPPGLVQRSKAPTSSLQNEECKGSIIRSCINR